MTPDAPEFHTKPSTPLSPLPYFPPEPSNITVLRNQIDPIFNMTSTHLDTSDSPTASVPSNPIPDQQTTVDAESDTLYNSSFSDPYDDQEHPADKAPPLPVTSDAGVDNEYAMTFDSEGEDSSSRQDVQSEEKPPSPPASVQPATAISFTSPSVTNSANPTSLHDLPTATPGDASPIPVSTGITDPVEPSPESQTHTYEEIANGEIDIQQLLDNITATAELNASNSASATPVSAHPPPASIPPPTFGLPAHASLPPRPQNNMPPLHSTYASQDNTRTYNTGPPVIPPPHLGTFRAPGAPGAIVAAGAPGTSTDMRNSLPPPPSTSFPPPSSGLSAPPKGSIPYPQAQRVSMHDRPAQSVELADGDDGEVQWGSAIQKLYEEFLADERMYVNEGTWDRFPLGSRLFVGNLPTEKVTKRDMFYAFHKYGRLAQLSIKQAYGFVQFHDAAACHNALEREQGQLIRGRKMHLEVSKPQKNTRNAAQVPAAAIRRSRTPEHSRNHANDRGGRGGQSQGRGGFDRYGRAGPSPRDGDFREQVRSRDEYRPMRSPTPPRGAYRGRDEYAAPRARDDYGRERRRSRSRSPYERDGGRYRNRSPSPRRDLDDDLQIPRRNPRDVPDVQIILMDELDRGFVSWVEDQMRKRNLKTEVMYLSPRLPLPAVIKRQILEGVLAVAQLTRRSQDISKIPLQVFDRKGGANNVRFDEYQDLDPEIAAELVLRAKQQQAQVQVQAPQQPPYGQPQFAAGQSYQPPVSAPVAANLASLVGNLDNAALQQLLGTLNSSTQQQQKQATQTNSAIDLAGILGGLAQQTQQTYQQQPPAQNTYNNAGVGRGAAAPQDLASLLSGAGANQGEQSAQQVQNIMAQLARFRQ